MERVNVLIAGGGVIGSALAFWLAKRGVRDIQVVDLDLAGIYASSELNAGGARATWWQPVNIATCAETLDFFREHADAFGFRQRGYLWLFDDPDLLRRARENIDKGRRAVGRGQRGVSVHVGDGSATRRRGRRVGCGAPSRTGPRVHSSG